MTPPPEAALPPVPLQPGTGILSHEYQEQKVLPRMVRVASLPQKKAPGDARQAAAAMTAPAPQTMTVAAVSTADRDERQAFAAAPARRTSFRPPSAPVIHDDIVPPAPEEWRRLAREAEEIFGLDAGLVLAVIQAESSFDHTAVSPVGAQGAMQIMPHTQEELGLIDPVTGLPCREQREIRDAVYLTSKDQGCWYPEVTPGAPVSRGTVLGTVRDIFGRAIDCYRAEKDGIILYMTVSLAVKAGTPLVAYG